MSTDAQMKRISIVPFHFLGKEPSLLEQDIREKIDCWLSGQINLNDFVLWLNNPLLLWQIVDEAAENPTFLVWIRRVHGYCTLYTEHNYPVQEILTLFSNLLSPQ